MRRTILTNLSAITALALTITIADAATATQANSAVRESAAPARLQKQARVTIDAARETALKRAPGQVESSELEREHGRLVYSFDIRNAHGTIDEVQVNALNGKIVRVEHESKKQEAAEKRQESRSQRKP